MMFAKKTKRQVTINTSSLPDIVFMMLFFFMVATVLKTEKNNLAILLPSAINPLIDKNKLDKINLYASQSDDEMLEVVVNDKLFTIEDLYDALSNVTAGLSPFELKKVEVYLNGDKHLKMESINKIKISMQQIGLSNLNYVCVAD